MTMLPDYHLHTKRCGHATGEMEEYVKIARKKGLSEIGFADHLPMYWLPADKRDSALAMDEKDLGAYIEDVKRLQEENPDLIIRLGIEADYIPGQSKTLRSLLSRYNFDYVLGSVHYIDGWGFDNPAFQDVYGLKDIDEIYDLYFSLLQEAANSGLFNIMAHPDLIKKFGYRSKRDPGSWYEKTARIFSSSGVCVEVNTAGLRAPVKEIYPAPAFLKACKKYGVSVTLGSDAHVPAQVAQGWELALELLRETDYREVVVFTNRLRHFYTF